VTTLTHSLADSSTMLRRQLRHTTRNPSTLVMSVLLPGVLLLLLDFGFGGAIRTGAGRYVDYLVPGIIMMAACYSVSATSVAVATDSSEGLVDRFRTMAIARSALLTGHVLSSVLRGLSGTTLVVLLALTIGFRPAAGPGDWLAVAGLVALLLFAIGWLATAIGLAAGNATGAASLAAVFQLLPFLSGAFVPTSTMPGWLQAFAANQPMTHIVATLRGLLTGTPVGGHGPLAVAWCVATALAGYGWARTAYERRARR